MQANVLFYGMNKLIGELLPGRWSSQLNGCEYTNAGQLSDRLYAELMWISCHHYALSPLHFQIMWSLPDLVSFECVSVAMESINMSAGYMKVIVQSKLMQWDTFMVKTQFSPFVLSNNDSWPEEPGPGSL